MTGKHPADVDSAFSRSTSWVEEARSELLTAAGLTANERERDVLRAKAAAL